MMGRAQLNDLQKKLVKFLTVAIILLTVYFGNVQLQTWLGTQALENTHFTHLTLPEAESLAQRDSKYILVDVAAIWCPTCRRLDQDIFSNAEVHQYLNQNIEFVRLEYESQEARSFQKVHHDSGFPSLWLLNAKGEAIQKLTLTFVPQQFITELNDAMQTDRHRTAALN